jgi:hypothetical protein
MADKEKQATSNKFLIRSGGLALSLPFVLGLSFMLILLSVLLAVIIIGGLLNLGDVGGVVSPYIPWLSLFLATSISAIIILFRSVFRYTGGIRKLWQRLQGIKEEHERVERLMEKQSKQDDIELVDADDYQHQTKYQ